MGVREAVLYVLDIKGKPPLVVSHPPVLGYFTRMTTYKVVSTVKTYENGVKESVLAYKQDRTIWVNPAEIVLFYEKKCDVVE